MEAMQSKNIVFLSYKRLLRGTLLLFFVLGDFSTSSATFEDFTPVDLQIAIRTSRHHPFCVIFKENENGTQLENITEKSWLLNYNITSWKLGRFVHRNVSMFPHLKNVVTTPLLRCYYGPHQALDYEGKLQRSSMEKWLQNILGMQLNQLQEASKDKIEHAINICKVVILGISNRQSHAQIEEILYQVRDESKELYSCVFFSHPTSPYITYLKSAYKIKQESSVLFLEKQNTKDFGITLLLKNHQISKENIMFPLLIKTLKWQQLKSENFEKEILEETKYYDPTFVLFYLPKLPESVHFLSALHQTSMDIKDLNISAKFTIYDLSQKGSSEGVLLKLKNGFSYKPPFTILFDANWKGSSVIGIDQFVFHKRPTPSEISSALYQRNKMFKTRYGDFIFYQPYDKWNINEMSLLTEGPHGHFCYTTSSNLTDSQPFTWQLKVNKTVKSKAKTTIKSYWHQRFGSEYIDEKLEHIGDIPIVEESTWQEVIEKSHSPRHPFNPGGKWRGEVTKVALVIFLISDCGSCRRNMDFFMQLHKEVVKIDGGAFYLVNCTSSPRLCSQLSISGFPSLAAFRGLGWLEGIHCSKKASEHTRFVRMDYHGVLTLSNVMEWFSWAADQAVHNIKWDDHKTRHDMSKEVHLIATVMPKESPYLPRVPKRKLDRFYPYECLRLACERLYGQASCYVRYSLDVPKNVYENENDDMIITEVILHRVDGLEAHIMQLNRPLATMLEEEAELNTNKFHMPHRYSLAPQLTCEDAHSTCTDLLVDFTRDHSRLPVTHMNLATFHDKNSVLFKDSLPVLVALVQAEHVVTEHSFMKLLQAVSEDYYDSVVVVTVDVDQYPAWASQFIPIGQAKNIAESEETSSFYIYPRLCMIDWTDHQHAAFYPPVHEPIGHDHPFKITKEGLVHFMDMYLKDPQAVLIETEHF